MKWLSPDFIEGCVLPIVIAFGLGVLAATTAHDAERDAARQALRTAHRAVLTCNAIESGPAAAHIATAHEVQP